MGTDVSVIKLRPEDVPMALDLQDRHIRRAIYVGTLAGAHRGRAIIVKRTPTDQGQLRASWKVKPGTEPDGPQAFGVGHMLAELVNDAPHISMVELGAKPHRISPEAWAAIYEWVRRHFRSAVGGGNRRSGGVYTLGGAGKMVPRGRSRVSGPWSGDDPRITYITNAIAFKIRKYGQKPTLFVRNSVDELRDVMGYELQRELGKVTSKLKTGGQP